MREREPRLLAVVRCGDKSLHREWACASPMFDVAVSYFGADAARDFPEARYHAPSRSAASGTGFTPSSRRSPRR